MLLRGQLYTHTTCSDGSLTPQEVAGIYAGMGFDFLAFTDHDHLLKPSYRLTLASIRSELLIFSGIELTVKSRKGYVHVSRIEGDREILHIFNHPADCGLPLRETLKCIAEVAERYSLDAVEATSHGFPTPLFDIPGIGYPRVAADDSHELSGCGRAWIELDCDRDKDAIVTAIREGRFQNGYAGWSPAVSGAGWGQMQAILEEIKLGVSAMCVGVGMACMEESTRHAKAKKAFGKPIGLFEGVGAKLATMFTFNDLGRMMTCRAAWAIEQGDPEGPVLASCAKLFTSEAAGRIADLAMQVHGGHGYLKGAAVERLYRDARFAAIAWGTSEMQRAFIAKDSLDRFRAA